jgi:endonuclease YncB( thermonuclease family)
MARRIVSQLLCLALLASAPISAARANCPAASGSLHAVARVIDGQALVLDDGTTVVLLGVLAPRAEDGNADPGLWLPEQEARAALERLTAGRSLAVAGPRSRDRHGRLPAHLHIVDGAAPVWVQGALVEAGAVRAHTPLDGDGCAETLLELEARARTAGLGLWRHAAYQPLDALRTRNILQRRDTFQIVRGRIAHVSDVRGQIYLNFGSDWREDFTVAIGGAVRRRLEARGIRPKELAGQLVEARGWIERRNGPLIVLRQAEDLRVMAPTP